jgi:hypothetical protein
LPALGPHRNVDVAEIVALFKIAAKHTNLANAFQQVGPRIDRLQSFRYPLTIPGPRALGNLHGQAADGVAPA